MIFDDGEIQKSLEDVYVKNIPADIKETIKKMIDGSIKKDVVEEERSHFLSGIGAYHCYFESCNIFREWNTHDGKYLMILAEKYAFLHQFYQYQDGKDLDNVRYTKKIIRENIGKYPLCVFFVDDEVANNGIIVINLSEYVLKDNFGKIIVERTSSERISVIVFKVKNHKENV